ncbi:superoxide dismutase, Fe-Mn family [bacterium A37T11]|nr:superoxide dismutase, Fe-Mn family [bacterium A37T11]
MAFTLPAIPYSTDVLKPTIDKATMEIHHGKHHQSYEYKLKKAIAGTDAEHLTIEEIIENISKYPAAVRNNGGGHYNHSVIDWVKGASNYKIAK